MRASAILPASLAIQALASPFIVRTNQAAAAELATSYTISGFNTFTATPGSSPGISSVEFSISDNLDNLATCQYLSDANAPDAADATHFHACANPDFSFNWNGKTIAIVELYSISGPRFSIVQSVNAPKVFCVSSEGSTLGLGTKCETTTDQISGDFVAMTAV